MISWITKNLGTSSFTNVKSKNIHIVDVRDLVDRKGNSPKIIKTKIGEAITGINNGKKVAICCDYGISRSNAIAAGVLSRLEKIDFEEAIKIIQKKTGENSITIGVLSDVSNTIKITRRKKKVNDIKKILVTGSSGFIGSSLIPVLKNNFNVFTPAHKDINLEKDIVKLDQYIKKYDIDTFLHLANPQIYTTNESMGKSLTMLKNVLDVCNENKLFFVYLSSWEIYSGYKTSMRARESLEPKPNNTYGYTKMLCEALINSYNDQFGLDTLIIRTGPIYGPQSDKPKFIWTFLSKALRNEDIVTHKYKNGFPKLDLMYIDDVVEGFLEILQKKIKGSINLGTGVSTSTKDVAKLIIKITRSKSRIKHVKIQDFVSNIVMDSKRVKKELKWRPNISIEDGLNNLIKTNLKTRQVLD